MNGYVVCMLSITKLRYMIYAHKIKTIKWKRGKYLPKIARTEFHFCLFCDMF